MLKKIIVASVLSSLMGISCYESEAAVSPRLEDQVRMPGAGGAAGVPNVGAAAAKAVHRMRGFGRTKSVGNFEEFIRQHPGTNQAVANYIARNTAGDGSAKNGNNYSKFVQEWAIPAASIQQNPDGSYSIAQNALDTYKEQMIRESLRAAKYPQDPNESPVVADIRNEITQAGDDAIDAFEYEISDPQTQDQRAQRVRGNVLTAFENEIRSLYQPAPAGAANAQPVAPNVQRDLHVNTTLQLVKDVVQRYQQLPANQRPADQELSNLRSEVVNNLQNEIQNLVAAANVQPAAPNGQPAAPNAQPAAPNAQDPDALSTLVSVRGTIGRYLQLPANQRNIQELNDIIADIRAHIVANIH